MVAAHRQHEVVCDRRRPVMMRVRVADHDPGALRQLTRTASSIVVPNCRRSR
jgi:hypothetical protein